MNTEQVKDVVARLRNLALLAHMVTEAELVDLVNECEHTHALAPILQPTWYQGAMGGVDELQRVARAALDFRRELKAVGIVYGVDPAPNPDRVAQLEPEK